MVSVFQYYVNSHVNEQNQLYIHILIVPFHFVFCLCCVFLRDFWFWLFLICIYAMQPSFYSLCVVLFCQGNKIGWHIIYWSRSRAFFIHSNTPRSNKNVKISLIFNMVYRFAITHMQTNRFFPPAAFVFFFSLSLVFYYWSLNRFKHKCYDANSFSINDFFLLICLMLFFSSSFSLLSIFRPWTRKRNKQFAPQWNPNTKHNWQTIHCKIHHSTKPARQLFSIYQLPQRTHIQQIVRPQQWPTHWIWHRREHHRWWCRRCVKSSDRVRPLTQTLTNVTMSPISATTNRSRQPAMVMT